MPDCTSNSSTRPRCFYSAPRTGSSHHARKHASTSSLMIPTLSSFDFLPRQKFGRPPATPSLSFSTQAGAKTSPLLSWTFPLGCTTSPTTRSAYDPFASSPRCARRFLVTRSQFPPSRIIVPPFPFRLVIAPPLLLPISPHPGYPLAHDPHPQASRFSFPFPPFPFSCAPEVMYE